MSNTRKPIRRRCEPVGKHARLMKSAMRKLEVEPLSHHFYSVLTPDEVRAARELIREAVALVWAHIARRRRAPQFIDYCGARYQLAYSSFGRLFIVSPKSGRSLISSDFNAI